METLSRNELGARLGTRFIEALVQGDFDAMRSLLHPQVRFRGLSPHKFLRTSSADPVGGVIRAFRLWFFEGEGDYPDHPEELQSCTVAPFGYGGRFKLSYRIRSKSREMAEAFRAAGLGDLPDDTDWVVDQEAYYDVLDARIGWMIVLCGGYMPMDPVPISDNIPETAARQITL